MNKYLNAKAVVYFEDTSKALERSDLDDSGSRGLPEISLPAGLKVIEKRLYPDTEKLASILTESISEPLLDEIRESASSAGTVAWIREDPSYVQKWIKGIHTLNGETISAI